MTALLLTLALVSQPRYCPGGCPPERAPTSRVVGPTAAIDPGYARVVVRLENHLPGAIHYGSGVIMTRTGLVLTCKHIFEEGVGSLVVRRSDGQSWTARFIATDPSNDLGAVAIGATGPVPPVRFSATQPPRAVIVGFPGRGLVPSARIGRYEKTQNVYYGVNSVEGISGGPAFWPNTLYLCGVQWGSDGRSSAVTSIDDVHRFVKKTCFPFYARLQSGNSGFEIQAGAGSPVLPAAVLPQAVVPRAIITQQFTPVYGSRQPIQQFASPQLAPQLATPQLVPQLASPQVGLGPDAGPDPGIALARLAALEARMASLVQPITFIDAGGRVQEVFLGDTVRIKIPAVNPDLQMEVRHGGAGPQPMPLGIQ